jgi:hypothetical protein
VIGYLVKSSVIASLLALSVITGVGVTAGAASVNSEPSPGSPIASWTSWAGSVNNVTTTTNWNTVANDAGCQLISSAVVTANDAALGIPSGVTLDGIALQVHCGSTSNSSDVVSPDFTTNCPVFQYWNGASVTDGYECVGTYTVGTQAYTGAQYTYETTGSVTGHEELGTVSSGCSTGTAAANSGTVTLSNGDGEIVAIPVDYSDNWSATWWKGSSSPYTNWGTVCGSY